ncbi:MAG: hypothetical protein ACYSUB_20745 [Planctomycetota bacterium]|jgi:hypothetical protein
MPKRKKYYPDRETRKASRTGIVGSKDDRPKHPRVINKRGEGATIKIRKKKKQLRKPKKQVA